ncbi:MAG: MFS transporter [Beijerinckiaceae bacterium]
MSLFANADLNRMQIHGAMRCLSDSVGVAFSAVFLLRQGLSPASVYLAFAAIFALRLSLRWLAVRAIARVGLRRGLIAGAMLYATQFLALAAVTGPGAGVALYIVTVAVADALYWTAYHTAFASAGALDDRGRQIGAREILSQFASIAGPVAGGMALTLSGPWLSFGLAAAIACLSILPLLKLSDAAIARTPPPGMWRAAKSSAILFATDGWIVMGAQTAWTFLVFKAFDSRFDAYGAALSVAALAGAAATFLFGKSIDTGNARRAVVTAGLCLATLLCLQAANASDPVRATLVLIAGAAIGHLYLPGLMSAVYNSAKSSSCALRYILFTESGWDCGAAGATLLCALIAWSGAPLQAGILLGLPAVLLQTWLLAPRFRIRGAAA